MRNVSKVNDIIFPSGCEARAINLGNKNVKIGTSVRSKNIFNDISRYRIGKHEIKCNRLTDSQMDLQAESYIPRSRTWF